MIELVLVTSASYSRQAYRSIVCKPKPIVKELCARVIQPIQKSLSLQTLNSEIFIKRFSLLHYALPASSLSFKVYSLKFAKDNFL